MKYGVFSVGMPEYSVEETVKVLKEIGYHGVEWRVQNGVPKAIPENIDYERRYWQYNLSTLNIDTIAEDAEGIYNLCAQAGLEVCSLSTYTKPHETEKIENALRAAVTMKCPQIRVNAPQYDGTKNYWEILEEARQAIGELEILAKKYGVKINFEQHMGTIIPSASACYRLVSGFDPKYIGITVDPGNMVNEGYENYKMGIEILGDYLAHVHIKNSCWKFVKTDDNGMDVWNPEWVPLKKGSANLTGFIQLLKEYGYDKYLCIEDFSNQDDTLTKLKDGLEFLKSV
ncbi:MAG: Inosose dehydratase [Firmicutes bacterium ADurb.Bin193]|nr:MAG: Inosose dehydratase [Firmicutes bacterium ADurb.Bin193]